MSGEATPEELVDLGVETGVDSPVEDAPSVRFEQVDDLPGEPVTDVKIRLEDGTEFRERLIPVPIEEGFCFSISNALLAEDGSVALNPDGSPRIVPAEVRHELRIDAVAAGGMSVEAIIAVRDHARGVAAAKAQSFFAGMDRAREVFAGRLTYAAKPQGE